MNTYISQIRKKSRLYFVRHAETEYNAAHIVAGSENSKLTERGVAQATFTGDYFKDKNISLVVHSPLLRTIETAQLITRQGGYEGIKFIEFEDLIEINTGELTHKVLADVQVQDPKLYAEFRKNSWEAIPGAERIQSIVSRCEQVWKKTLELTQEGYENILFVSHGGFINWIFKSSFSLEGNHLAHWAPVLKVKNCAIYELIVEPSPEDSCFCFWNTINYTSYN